MIDIKVLDDENNVYLFVTNILIWVIILNNEKAQKGHFW